MKSKKETHHAFSSLKFGLLLSLGLFQVYFLQAQYSVYDDFEGKGSKLISYGERGGVLDTNAKDPSPKDVNKPGRCAMYIRNGAKKFDNIKMPLKRNLNDVDLYATHMGIPPRLRMKIYTSAPAGTLVEILLGSKRGNNDYPAGTHSQYQAYTTKSNQWEELEFKFSQIPQGSETSAAQIDQVTLLFNPNSANSDVYYFDELTGPPVAETTTTTHESKGATIMNTDPGELGAAGVPAVETTKPVTTVGTQTETVVKPAPVKNKKNKK